MAKVLPPAAAYLLVAALLVLAAIPWSTSEIFTPGLWLRWDSYHYLEIARNGYSISYNAACPCWTGNPGWFPGYPWLIKLFSLTGIPPELGGVLVAHGFVLASLVLVWRKFLGGEACLRSVLVLALSASFFGAIYRYAYFPISLVAFLLLVYCAALAEKRYLMAAAAALGAAIVYPVSLLLSAVAVIFCLRGLPLPEIRQNAWKLLVVLIAPVIGFGFVLFVQFISVGMFDAFFLVQKHIGPMNDTIPEYIYAKTLRPLTPGSLNYAWDLWQQAARRPLEPADPSLSPEHMRKTRLTALGDAIRDPVFAVHDVLLLLFLISALLFVPQKSALERALLASGFLFFFFPFFVGRDVNLIRAHGMLQPVALLALKMPKPLTALFLAAAAALALPCAYLFFVASLI